MKSVSNIRKTAEQLWRSQGVAAHAFAHARSVECFFYQDLDGEAYWLSVEKELATPRPKILRPSHVS